MTKTLLNFKERLPNRDPILSLGNASFMLKKVIGDLFRIKPYFSIFVVKTLWLFAMKEEKYVFFDMLALMHSSFQQM